jgi:hypothetical protein
VFAIFDTIWISGFISCRYIVEKGYNCNVNKEGADDELELAERLWSEFPFNLHFILKYFKDFLS